MKLTALHVFAAFPLIDKILGEKRPLPLKGAYRLARLHAKLQSEYATIANKHNDLILAYGYKAQADGTPDDGMTAPELLAHRVPPEKLAEFTANWTEIASEEIDVAVEPIPLSQLDLGDDVAGSITALELLALGDLVVDDSLQPVAQAA